MFQTIASHLAIASLLIAQSLICVSSSAEEPAPALRPIAEALETRLTTAVHAGSLTELASQLAESAHIKVAIDDQLVVDGWGVNPDVNELYNISEETLPFAISDVTLRSALEVLYRQCYLSFTIEDDVLQLTTSADSYCRVHPIADLISDASDYASLCELILCTFDDNNWTRPLKYAPITVGWGCLIFEQSPSVHDSVEALLSGLRSLKSRDPLNFEPIRFDRPSEIKFEAELSERLDEVVDMRLENVTIADFAVLLRDRYKLPVRIDRVMLDGEGIEPTEARVKLNVRQVSLRKAIALALQSYKSEPYSIYEELATFPKSEQFWIGSKDGARSQLRLAIYPVSDLANSDNQNEETLARSLAAHVLRDVSAYRSSVQAFSKLHCLVVMHSEEGHNRIAAFLDDLRKHRAPANLALPTLPQPLDGKTPPPTLYFIDAKHSASEIAKVLPEILHADGWIEEKGFSCVGVGNVLIVRQPEAVIRRIERLLTDLQARSRDPRSGLYSGPGPVE